MDKPKNPIVDAELQLYGTRLAALHRRLVQAETSLERTQIRQAIAKTFRDSLVLYAKTYGTDEPQSDSDLCVRIQP